MKLSTDLVYRLTLVSLLGLLICLPANNLQAKNDDDDKLNPHLLTAPIRIGIIGDQTGTHDLAQAYLVLQAGVAALKNRQLDVVLHVGDLLESSKSLAEIQQQFSDGTTILDTLNVPWYMTPGDHDVNPPSFKQDSTDRSRETLFKQLYGARVPAVKKHPYYSFDVKGYHFIALYSHETLHADPRWGNIFLAQITDQQYQWLADDLRQHANAKGVVVFIHQPLWYNWSAWTRVHHLLQKHRVAAVVSGHFHYDQGERRIGGIHYLTVGATGGTVKQGDRDAGNVQHVSVIKVEGKQLTGLKLIAVSDNLPLKITPRVDMDKIQALDVMLGELWNFASTNPVFVKNGTLLNDCNSTTPAGIHITPLGNPTDTSLNIRISYSSDDKNILLASAGFVTDQCNDIVGPFECNLQRSSRIFFSNLSSVSVNPYAGPLWRATLGVVQGETPNPGAKLHFDIRLGYAGKSGDLALTRRASTSVVACP